MARKNRCIGVNQTIPWHLPSDLKRFKSLTMSGPIIMGRKTHESIGRLLPQRLNIILSRDPAYRVEGAMVVDSVGQALDACEKLAAPENFVIGGQDVFLQLLKHCQRIYLTEVDIDVEGDCFFPQLDESQWVEVAGANHLQYEGDSCPYSFVIKEKITTQ